MRKYLEMRLKSHPLIPKTKLTFFKGTKGLSRESLAFYIFLIQNLLNYPYNQHSIYINKVIKHSVGDLYQEHH